MSAVNDLGTDNDPLERSADYDERILVEAELLNTGDQALTRGLDTAFPILRPGCSCLTASAGHASHKARTEVPLSLSHPRQCARGELWLESPPSKQPT